MNVTSLQDRTIQNLNQQGALFDKSWHSTHKNGTKTSSNKAKTPRKRNEGHATFTFNLHIRQKVSWNLHQSCWCVHQLLSVFFHCLVLMPKTNCGEKSFSPVRRLSLPQTTVGALKSCAVMAKVPPIPANVWAKAVSFSCVCLNCAICLQCFLTLTLVLHPGKAYDREGLTPCCDRQSWWFSQRKRRTQAQVAPSWDRKGAKCQRFAAHCH